MINSTIIPIVVAVCTTEKKNIHLKFSYLNSAMSPLVQCINSAMPPLVVIRPGKENRIKKVEALIEAKKINLSWGHLNNMRNSQIFLSFFIKEISDE